MANYPYPSTYQSLRIPTSIDYTSKDYQSLRASMLAFANSPQGMPDWDTSLETDFGVLLVELFAYALDIISFYGDRAVQESYLTTATQRLSLLNIAQLLDYTPSNGTPASGTVTFQTSNPGTAVYLPELTQVATTYNTASQGTQIIYETMAPATVPGNGGTITVPVTQGQTQGSPASPIVIGTSDGTAGQEFTLPQLSVIDGSITIYVQATTGWIAWNQVSYLVDSAASDQVYNVSTDANGATVITFGDNVGGLIPALGLQIGAVYRIGTGSAGNQPAGVVGTIVMSQAGVFIPTLDDNKTFQSSAMTGGSDPESNDSIRANAPLAYRTQYRAVSLQDYNDLALTIPGVVTANAIANHSTSVSIYILGPANSNPDTVLINNVTEFFENGAMLAGVDLSVLPPSLIPIDVGSAGNPVTLQVKDNYDQDAVVASIKNALTAFLTAPNVGFGQLLNVSDFYNAILSVDGVAWCLIGVFTREDTVQTDTTSIQLRASEVPVPGSFYFSASGGL